jgi:predicted nucleotide-binding protein
MNAESVSAVLQEYIEAFQRIQSRVFTNRDIAYLYPDDDLDWRQKALEIRDFLTDTLGPNVYSAQILDYYTKGMLATGTPSRKSVQDTIGVLKAVITRLQRNPGLLERRAATASIPSNKNVFLIHGRDEGKWRELKDILRDKFQLNPIVLNEQPDAGCSTLVEKFEYYAKNCSYAMAIFTPDDQVTSLDGETYVQARPNVIYELGWFCGRLDRKRVILLLKDGTSVFSDFGGIMLKQFRTNVAERIDEIRRDLIAAGVIS